MGADPSSVWRVASSTPAPTSPSTLLILARTSMPASFPPLALRFLLTELEGQFEPGPTASPLPTCTARQAHGCPPGSGQAEVDDAYASYEFPRYLRALTTSCYRLSNVYLDALKDRLSRRPGSLERRSARPCWPSSFDAMRDLQPILSCG
ncbi:MAG: hypothetical protein ACLU0O_00900 [Collinsella sp.]